jgi:hypothetical protein
VRSLDLQARSLDLWARSLFRPNARPGNIGRAPLPGRQLASR